MAQVLCPFCGFRSNDGEEAILLHIEQYHTEDSTLAAVGETVAVNPRTSTQNAAAPGRELMPSDIWTRCTRPHCGQDVLLSDVDEHLRLHEVEAMSGGETPAGNASPPDRSLRIRRSPTETRRRSGQHRSSRNISEPKDANAPKKTTESSTMSQFEGTAYSILRYFAGTSHTGRAPPRPAPPRRPIRQPLQPGRLGKRELGPQAFEEAMPARTRQSLIEDARPREVNRIGRDGCLRRETFVENETTRLIYDIGDLCALDPGTEATYFCDANTKHISRLRCDGNFCGYWNIQMVLSHVRGRQYPGRHDMQVLPNVLQIQDIIEQAWDNSICSYGRIETGGIRGTRKWIGTHETVAFFTQIGVRVEALSFRDEQVGDTFQPAVVSLLDHVEAYFMSGLDDCGVYRTSHVTKKSPIYFQRFGHSTTIVGLERRKDGSRNLIVFDPSFETSNAMKRVRVGMNARASPEQLLRAYRRNELGLNAWREFEIVVPQPHSETTAT